jgi:hypothetical protein
VYRAGKHTARTAPGRDPPWNSRAKDERGNDVFMRTSEAASYITETFYTMLDVFYMSETLGCLPFAGGWAEQPEWIVRALSVLKVERARVDREEQKQRQQEEEDRRKYGRR